MDRRKAGEGARLWPRRVVLKLGGSVVMSAWLAPMAGCGGSS